MSSPLPYCQFYCKEWLASSNTRKMNLAARGAYIDLLCYQWEEGSIPNDLAEIAKMLGCTKAKLSAIWSHLDNVFPLCEDGKRRNPRCENDRVKAHKKSQTNSENGAKGGRKSSEFEQKPLKKRKPTLQSTVSENDEIKDDLNPENENPLSERLPNAKRNESQPEPEPYPQKNMQKSLSAASRMFFGKMISGLPEEFQTDQFAQSLAAVLKMRETRHFGEWGDNAVLLFLREWPVKGPRIVIAALDTCLATFSRRVVYEASETPVARRLTPKENAELRGVEYLGTD